MPILTVKKSSSFSNAGFQRSHLEPASMMTFSRETFLSPQSKMDLLNKDRQWQDSLISQHDSLKHLESSVYLGAKCGMLYWKVVQTMPSMLHQLSTSSLGHYLVTAPMQILQSPQISLSLNIVHMNIYQWNQFCYCH